MTISKTAKPGTKPEDCIWMVQDREFKLVNIGKRLNFPGQEFGLGGLAAAGIVYFRTSDWRLYRISSQLSGQPNLSLSCANDGSETPLSEAGYRNLRVEVGKPFAYNGRSTLTVSEVHVFNHGPSIYSNAKELRDMLRGSRIGKTKVAEEFAAELERHKGAVQN